MASFDQREQQLLRNRDRYASQIDYRNPQGQMVGNTFVPPNALQYLAEGLRSFGGMRGEQLANQELSNLKEEKQKTVQSEMKALTDALRGTPADVLPEGESGPVRPAQPGSMDAFYQRASQSTMPEFQQIGMQGQLEQAKAMQAQAQRQQQMQLVAGMTPQQAIAQGIDPALVKQYHEGRNIGRDKVTWQNVGDKLVPVTEFGDTPQGVKEQVLRMSQAERDASARGWANVSQGQQRLAMDAQNQGAGKAPQGYRFTQDGNLEAIPGGPADIKAGELGQKQEKSKQAAIAQAGRVIEKVDQALSKVGMTSAGLGSSLAGIPGTTAKNLESDLQTIKANLGFAELQAMRDASPTGGALGAIAVQELTALQATVASLDQAQSPDQLRKSLGEIRRHYQNWQNAVQGKAPQGQGSRLPSDVQSLINKYGG